jgi:hypothetical protein
MRGGHCYRVMMQKVVIILVFALVGCTIAGCTTASITNETPSAAASAATSTATRHDAFLEKYLAAVKDSYYADKDLNITAWDLTWTNSSSKPWKLAWIDSTFKTWELTWINSTSARLELTALNNTANLTVNGVTTYAVFPTTQDATNYLNAMNKTAYSMANSTYPSEGGIYMNVTGHSPQIYTHYVWSEGDQFNLSEYTRHDITQADTLIIVSTAKAVG